MSKRQESSSLIDTILEEHTERKKQRLQNSRDSHARTINRLAEREQDLQVKVENLKWEKKRLEYETLELKVERVREEEQREKRKTAEVSCHTTKPREDSNTEIIQHALPTPPPSTVSTPIGPVSLLSPPCTPPQPISQLPLQSSYEPFLQSTDIRPFKIKKNLSPATPNLPPSSISPHQYPNHTWHVPIVHPPMPYVPHYVNAVPLELIPKYIPTPIQPLNTLESNPIRSFSDRSSAYWRRFEIAIKQLTNLGKHKLQNPEDNLWFQVQVYSHGRTRVRLSGKWWLIEDGCNQKDH